MRAAQPLGPVLDRLVAAARLHRLDIAAGAPAAPGAGDDDRTAIMVGRKALQRLLEALRHRRRQRIQALRPVQGQGRDAVVAGFEQVGHGVSPERRYPIIAGFVGSAPEEAGVCPVCPGSGPSESRDLIKSEVEGPSGFCDNAPAISPEWDLETVRVVCAHDCPDMCSLLAEVEGGRVLRIKGDPDQPFTAGFACAKVNRDAELVHSPERLQTPLRRTGAKGAGKFVPIGWDEALDEIVARWRSALCTSWRATVWSTRIMSRPRRSGSTASRPRCCRGFRPNGSPRSPGLPSPTSSAL